ncbi:MAG: glutamate--tRNA ligase [Candidatus Marinimicrobia bacterium]|nr:glutamate--tRNA ligase [Candidatus Neomarinimicrobiota bacterium]
MVRTRFAPSPTGFMHIGNLRTALYAYLIAKHDKGKFILRIEDTDQKRFVKGAIDLIYDSLKISKIEYDEGPDKHGDFGPYIQSERNEIYKKHIGYLIEKGFVYRCFCKKEELERQREESKRSGEHYKYNRKCRSLSMEEISRRLNSSEQFVVRQKIPDTGETSFNDCVFGIVSIKNELLDDVVLFKSDGYPTYNFAHVVDDHLMNITHVVRGVEYLSSTPQYILLYKNFGWKIPKYVHLPHITKESGKKLSKREGDASFQELLKKGYLPEAIINYIALLGWNPGDEREFFTIEELIKEFRIERINKSNAIFTIEKLNWINGEHIRKLSPGNFHTIAQQYFPKTVLESYNTEKISRLIQPRIERLTDIPKIISFFSKMPDYSPELYVHKKMKSTLNSGKKMLEKIYPVLQNVEEWNNNSLYQELVQFAKESDVKNSTVLWPLRIALSGLQSTPGGATEIAEILGKEETLRRIEDALNILKEYISTTQEGLDD